MIMNCQLILNNNGRLETLRELFKNLYSNKIGKYDSSHYCVDTSITLRETNSQEAMTFNMLQQDSRMKGYLVNIYSFDIIN